MPGLRIWQGYEYRWACGTRALCDIDILGWCPAGTVVGHGEKEPL